MGAQADFPLPLEAAVGVSYRPTPDWNIEVDAEYADWAALNTVTIQQPYGVQSPNGIAPLVPQNFPEAFNLQSTWDIELGATRYLTNGWSASAGFVYSEGSSSKSNLSPFVADLDRYFVSLGFGQKGKRFDFDVAYQAGFSADTWITQSAAGKWGFFSQAIMVSVGVHF